MALNRSYSCMHPVIDEDNVKAREPIRSRSASPDLSSLLEARVSRRSTLRGGLDLAAATLFPAPAWPVATAMKATATTSMWARRRTRRL